jgi:hypothetical protein
MAGGDAGFIGGWISEMAGVSDRGSVNVWSCHELRSSEPRVGKV